MTNNTNHTDIFIQTEYVYLLPSIAILMRLMGAFGLQLTAVQLLHLTDVQTTELK